MGIYYYCANNTNDYGTGIHQVSSIQIPSNKISSETLGQTYDFVVINDTLSSDISGFPNKLVIDETTADDDPIVREKNASEYLEDAKPLKINEIGRAFEDQLTLGCPVSGVGSYDAFKVDCKPEDISNWTSSLVLINTAEELGSPLTEMPIRTYDNEEMTLSILEYKQMCLITGNYYMGLYMKKWNLCGQAENATTQAELGAITW